MEIVRIFEGDNNLFAVKFQNSEDDEFTKIFEQWNDIKYLDNFFEINKKQLIQGVGAYKNKHDFVLGIRELAGRFEESLLEYEKMNADEQKHYLDEIFIPLRAISFRESSLRQSKSKKSILRIYALRINKESYIITGGAIKLTQKMEDSERTLIELEKLNKCRDFLIGREITDIEQFENIL